jgi:hypothetical protein
VAVTGLENREDSLVRLCDTLYPQKLAITCSTCGGRSVGIVRLRIKATEFRFLIFRTYKYLSILLQRVEIMEELRFLKLLWSVKGPRKAEEDTES